MLPWYDQWKWYTFESKSSFDFQTIKRYCASYSSPEVFPQMFALKETSQVNDSFDVDLKSYNLTTRKCRKRFPFKNRLKTNVHFSLKTHKETEHLIPFPV